jgi:DNA-binding MurR/RpiR family transcriptional regulator
MTKSVVACVEDLFFRSKIEATARHLNVPVVFVKPEEMARASAGAGAVLLELSSNGSAIAAVEELRRGKSAGVPVIGFLSHIDKDLARKAEEAGVTRVMPRSQFSEGLPDLLMDLLAPGTKREMQEEPELPDE